MHLTAREISEATGGAWRPEEAVRDLVVKTISTDTRQIAPGDLFIALRGGNFDAHDFLDRAVEGGACALVVREDCPPSHIPPNAAVLAVPDTLRALGEIAAHWRRRCPAHRTAVVGSSGKTTTKDMLALLLGARGQERPGAQDSPAPNGAIAGSDVLASKGNLNNLIGLPLTLFRLEPFHKWAVLELGMNEPGELRRLVEIAEPNLLLFLAVGSAHVGQFGSLEALLDAKSDAVRALAENAPILYDADSPNTCEIIRRHGGGRPLSTFGVEKPAAVRAENVRPLPREGYAFDLCFETSRVPARLPLFGRYNVANAVAAAAAAHALGVSPERIARTLETFRPALMRSEVRSAGGVTLIVDCYNASPEGMMGALASRGDWPNREGRTFLVLGEMLELGEESAAFHARVGRRVADLAPDGAFLIGDGMLAVRDAWKGSEEAVRHFNRLEDLARSLIETVRPGDQIFFKGSRGRRLEVVVDLIEKAFKAGPARPGSKERTNGEP